MFKNIDDAVNWITNLKRGDNNYYKFKEICNELGNPQDKLNVIHVAGTDGKGSTVAFLRDLLMSQGFKVGTLQSPHYETHQDRIRLNGNNITDDAFLRILNEHYDYYVSKKLGMFEIDYLIMVQYFLEENVDFAVIEVGMGGRLDSTNVINNTKLSIITTIGYDHMSSLGDTLEKICIEKCGIIKNSSKVLTGHLNKELDTVVSDIAKERNSEYYKLGEYKDLGERLFEYNGEEYRINSYAKYQMHNASLALCAFEMLSRDFNFLIDLSKAKAALNSTNWKGRFEIVKENPRVILDGAHNVHGVEALIESFDNMKGSKIIIFSALERKEFKKMYDMLKTHADRIIVTSFNYFGKLLDVEQLGEVEYIEDFKEAIDLGIRYYENVLICGSLYFLSEVVMNYHFEN